MPPRETIGTMSTLRAVTGLDSPKKKQERIEKMKQTKTKKITALMLVVIILSCVAVGFGVSAVTENEITPTARISSFNVEHRGAMHLACKVETTTAPEGATIGIMVWAGDATDYSASNKIWENYEISNDGAGTEYYASMPIAAKNIATEYQFAVVAKVGNTVTLLSKPVLQSVEGWAQTKLNNSETTDPLRINLYEKVIAYGKAASQVLSK